MFIILLNFSIIMQQYHNFEQLVESLAVKFQVCKLTIRRGFNKSNVSDDDLKN